MSQTGLLAAAQAALQDEYLPLETKALIKELIDEIVEQAQTITTLQAEAAENVAAEFAKQRVDHYRERAIKAENKLKGITQ